MNAKSNKSNKFNNDCLTDDTITHLETKKTPRQYHAGEAVLHYSLADAFETLFPPRSRGQDGYQYYNQYQLQQAVIKVANWYGFAVKCSGTQIICACSESHKQLSNAKKIQHQNSSTFFPDNDVQQKPTRKRESAPDVRCPFFIKVGPIWESGTSKANRQVRITSVFFQHNHQLRKDAIIEAKCQSHQYSIPAEVCLTLISLSRYGPIPTKMLRGYMQEQYSPTQKNNLHHDLQLPHENEEA